MWDSFKENMQSHFSGRSSTKGGLKNTLSQSITKDAMKNVVTPHSIPQFIVPSLAPETILSPPADTQQSSLSQSISIKEENNGQPKRLEHSMRSLSLTKPEHLPLSNPKKSSTKNKAIGQQQHPGLTLQHLLSIKAGFSTLTESPNTRRKESLFFSPPQSLQDVSSQTAEQREEEIKQASSSDSEFGQNPSPISSPFGMFRNHRRLARSAYESDSNSSRHSTPFSSPAVKRKIPVKKKSLEIYAHYNGFDSGYSPPLNCSKRCESNNTSSISPTFASKLYHEEKSDKIKRSYSSSNVVSGCFNVDDESLSQSLQDIPRIKVKLTYISKQEKINISIMEAENFFIGRTVYLKVSLLPRYYGYQRTDQLKVISPSTTLRERLTFTSVKSDDIPYMSLEVSCKEKQGRLRSAAVVGKCIVTLTGIDQKESNEFWLELKPPVLKENVHMQLSLCYDAMLGFVVSEVIGVRNIPKGSLGRYPDSYVVLAEEPQCDKNKKKQTEIKYRSKDPIFNQSFAFSMSNDKLIIVATLFLKDKVKGHWIAKGEVKLGQDVEHWSGQTHWAQALAQAGKPVTFWHLLTPP